MSIWVDSDEKLNQMLNALSDQDLLAVDTEFIRTNTFFPKIALIQISDGKECFLVDVLAVSHYDGLKRLLEDSDRTLIFHACAEDLEVLEHGLNIVPKNIFDTQIAAGIARRNAPDFSAERKRYIVRIYIRDLHLLATLELKGERQ